MNTAATATAEAPKEAPAQAATPESTPKRKMRMKYKLLLIVSSLLMMAFLRTGFIFVSIAMMPAIVAYYIDRAKRPYLFKTVFACNLSGTLPYIGRMIKEGPVTALQPILQSVDTWVIIYGSAISGYLMIMVMPIVAHVLFSKYHVDQVGHLQEKLQKIESEWGEEVTKFSKKIEVEED